ncbi:uncharacterized protein LOC112230970 isoform X3 [Oncorhynchus tshawytscha]|uniref:uncharacterized protein LOC112230970 isoform X3 n=1 Tax=Oncorhynchus tshawytscha TaxID=74940 RepID=UPI000D0A585E|nr:uncharacterized protein LOC112230970 isoform X3 [Oncorhynchus tshawytscha]
MQPSRVSGSSIVVQTLQTATRATSLPTSSRKHCWLWALGWQPCRTPTDTLSGIPGDVPGDVGCEEWPTGSLCPQHLLRAMLGAESVGPKTGTEHRAPPADRHSFQPETTSDS